MLICRGRPGGSKKPSRLAGKPMLQNSLTDLADFLPFDYKWSETVPFLILYSLVHPKSIKLDQNLYKFAGKPMLRGYGTDLRDFFTIQSGVV